MIIPTDQETWERLPAVVEGGRGPLPAWARVVATRLPRTAAAMLELDYAHRARSPLDPRLRATLRWVGARANRCEYSQVHALADARRAGMDEATIAAVTGDPSGWPIAVRDEMEFARLLAVDAPSIPDALFARLVEKHGANRDAAMVLLGAYGGFQDRVALGLGLTPAMEPEGPPEPFAAAFAPGAIRSEPIMPTRAEAGSLGGAGETVVDRDPEWSRVSPAMLRERLEAQRSRRPRLPIPTWEEARAGLPPEFAQWPTRIVWSLVTLGYVPELAIPWVRATRTMWDEAAGDRIFEESLFWVQTRAIRCNYCMGHCEMLLEVAGLDRGEVAERLRLLAGDDWSAFSPAEQRAFAYARKLSKAPWTATPDDYRSLEADHGPVPAMATFWWLCRGLYMTRVSDGFALPLEDENVFMGHGDPTESERK